MDPHPPGTCGGFDIDQLVSNLLKTPTCLGLSSNLPGMGTYGTLGFENCRVVNSKVWCSETYIYEKQPRR